ncbi:MAG: DUF371 domain-containing protein [Acidimicrobiia bacterium]|nr:DUF371 domain-containing protein [Acidimicrobiia bacterium]
MGHPAIRVTHDKTLELTAEAAITPRATCVAGVSAAFDTEALAQLRGAVTYEIGAGRWREGGRAVINPGHAVTDRFVIRRSGHADAVTLATGATAAAGDLGRELASALAEAGRPITCTITEDELPTPLVILAPAEPAGRLGSLWRRATATVHLDRLRPGPVGPAPQDNEVTVRLVSSVPAALLGPDAVSRLHSLVVAGVRLACPGDPLAAALLAAGLAPAPALQVGRATRRLLRQPDLARLVAGATVPLVLTAPADETGDLVAWLAAIAPARPCWVDDAAVDVGLALVPVRPGTDPAAERPEGLPGGGPGVERLVVVGPAPGGGRLVDLDGAVSLLVAAGVPARQLADALRPLGLRRSDLYRAGPATPGPVADDD